MRDDFEQGGGGFEAIAASRLRLDVYLLRTCGSCKVDSDGSIIVLPTVLSSQVRSCEFNVTVQFLL